MSVREAAQPAIVEKLAQVGVASAVHAVRVDAPEEAERALSIARLLRAGPATLALLLSIAACATGSSTGPSRAELQAMEEERQSLEMLLQRARFELQCPDATAQVLERYRGGPATMVGVDGCGRQVMYERRLRYSYRQHARTTQNTRWERKP